VKKIQQLSPGEEVEYINKALGYETFVKPREYWLDTKSPRLNLVLGSKELGVAYGKMILIAGETSSGKSAIAAWIAGLGQQDGADVAWVDGENSFDRRHVAKQGLDAGHRIRDKRGKTIGYTKVALFRPAYGIFGRKKGKKEKGPKRIVPEDVETAELLFDRVEAWMKLRRRRNPSGKRIVVVDSTTSFCPAEELFAGFSEQNMRTRSSPAVFLNTMTKRWVNLSLNTNALIILIAQLRDNPGKMFGNPKYVTGGNGIQYFPSTVVWMSRVKGGELMKGDNQIGVKGMIINRKNKMGGGSVEHKKCGYHSHFYENKWKFMSTHEVKGKI